MKTLFFLTMAIGISAAFPAGGSPVQEPEHKDVLEYVNPFIGTRSMGHVFPGACVPFGGVQLSPDTEAVPHNIDGKYQKEAYRYCAGYQYDDPTIVGFTHTHLSGTGHSDLSDILIMPTTEQIMEMGTADAPESGYRSRFSHSTEKASPGYYEVTLEDDGIRAQLTATERAGVHKYTYPENKEQYVVMDLNHGIYNYEGKTRWAQVRVENDTLITGYRITSGWSRTNYTYFAISFSKPIKNYTAKDRRPLNYKGFWRKFDTEHNFPEIGGRSVVMCLDFGNDPSPLEIKVALSAVGTTGARAALEAETGGLGFEEILAKAQGKWRTELSALEAEGKDDELTMLYTSLYHTMINPSTYMDIDGKYRGIDHEIHQAGPGMTNYTVFSVWDTYRALHPLFNLICRERSRDIAGSMLSHYSQSVHKMLPVWSHMGNENWCMIGYHGVSVIGDALDKGIEMDRALAMEAMTNTANCDYYDGTGVYKQLGYVPYDVNRNGSSITMEYAYDDWVIYNAALKAGDAGTAEKYRLRAMNYRNVFDPSSGFARARMSDGSWKEDFNLYETHDQGFIEGNSWNYSMYVPHDPAGLIGIMGGDKVFTERLDSLFSGYLPDKFFANTEDVTREGILGMYVHGNEPSHHVPYLYMWTSQPWKTQHWVREIMDRMYRPVIDGLCGNDDCGQMSAWYIFSAMGFYPVCPGSDQYVIGAPYLPYMKVRVGDGKYIEIKAPRVSGTNRYVHGIKLNGKPYDKAYFTFDDLKDGAVIEFDMKKSPARGRRHADDGKPYSLSTAEATLY